MPQIKIRLLMNFLELSKQRYSARNYSSDMIEQEKLDYILECGKMSGW